MTHGTWTAYSFAGCRCIECTQAGAARRRRGLPDDDPRHGTTNGYKNLGCRCTDCRAANTAYMRDYMARRVTA